MKKNMLAGITREVVVYLEGKNQDAKLKASYNNKGEVVSRRFYFNSAINIMLMEKTSKPHEYELFVADKRGIIVPPSWEQGTFPIPNLWEATSIEEVVSLLKESPLAKYVKE